MKLLFFEEYIRTERKDAFAGIRSSPILLENLGLTVVEFDEGASNPTESHAYEQAAFCLKGKLEYTFGEKDQEVKHVLVPGSAYGIGPWVPHSVRALEDSLVVECYSPPSDRHRARGFSFEGRGPNKQSSEQTA
jgi:quercetin dioxygenase-like cupin family protein